MQQQNIQLKPLSRQNVADLFAYFYSVRFFDRPAEAARGRRVFEEKRCIECHGTTPSGVSGAKPVEQWQSLGDPIELTAAMWAHSVNMRQAFSAKKIKWPELTGQDVSDLLIYVRNLPGTRTKPGGLTTAGTNGGTLFESKGCAGCHTGKLALRARLSGKTMSDIAAAMWSHATLMGTSPPALTAPEMSQIVAYLWNEQVLGTAGSVSDGKRAFAAKGCAGCHESGTGGAPSLSDRKGEFSAVSMVSALWQHGPQMREEMKRKGTDWPRFTPAQMENLIAYINGGIAARQ
jgi:mono/diheme cytochrome c family protein